MLQPMNTLTNRLAPKFTELWAQAESEYLDYQHQYEGFDVGKSIEQRFAELIVRRCITHVDSWTGTKYTPATKQILDKIQREFDICR